jgi:hypothetical protein
MLESQGIFSLAARSEATLSLARNVQLAQSQVRTQVTAHTTVAISAYQGSSSLAGSGVSSGYLDLMTNTSISPAAKLKAFLKDVLDKTDDKLITDEMLNRLQKATKSDNKEISAQKLQQAKAKLQALRAQAQLAAATGDAKTLRRIAQEVAAAAREIASAVRGLASGIAATAETADGSTSNSVPTALGATSAPETGSAQGSQGDANPSDANAAEGGATPTNTQEASTQQAATSTAPDGAAAPAAAKDANGKDDSQSSATTSPVPDGENPLAWGRQALNKLSSDAHLAIAQAKGLIEFLAQAARAARKHRADPDEDKAYSDLSRDVSSAIRDAGQEMTDSVNADTGAGTDSSAGVTIDTTAVAVQITTDVTITAEIDG